MKKIEIPSDMMKMAISLKSFGIDGCAWRARDALAVISYLSEQNAVILGGDVYKIMGNQIGTAYAGWHYDPITTKSARENIRAGEEKAVAYIRHFFSGMAMILFMQLYFKCSSMIFVWKQGTDDTNNISNEVI